MAEHVHRAASTGAIPDRSTCSWHRLIGIHLSNLEIAPYTGPESRPLSAAEGTYRERNEAFWQDEYGYKAIQSTKPQTLGYALDDSPAGLAAWILEKWRSWADSRGNLISEFYWPINGRDFFT